MQDSPLLGDDDHANDDAVEGAAERLEQRGLELVVEWSGLAPSPFVLRAMLCVIDIDRLLVGPRGRR